MTVRTGPNAPAPFKGGGVFVRLSVCDASVFASFGSMFVRVAHWQGWPRAQILTQPLSAIFCAFVDWRSQC